MAHLLHSPCNWSDFKGFFWSFPISLNLDKRFPGIITRLIIPKINILGFSVLLCLGVLSRSRLYWLIPPKWFPHYPSFCQNSFASFFFFFRSCAGAESFLLSPQVVDYSARSRDERQFFHQKLTKEWEKEDPSHYCWQYSVMISLMRWEKLRWAFRKLKVYWRQCN